MKNQDKIDVKYVLAALGKCPLAPGSPSGPPSPAVVSRPRVRSPGVAAKTAPCEHEASCSQVACPPPGAVTSLRHAVVFPRGSGQGVELKYISRPRPWVSSAALESVSS